ncbi:MAG: S-layer homology domain-containing protein, partial [Oscillospiraceae bacterium]
DTYTDALGHAWDNGKVTKQPTETETGTKTFTCTRCGETKTETIPKLAHEHSYKAVVTAPTCTEKGYTTHTCACGDSYVDTYTDALGHAWDNGKVTKQPTETETGTKTFTCTRCGETKTEIIPKLTHEHSYKAVVTAPTCTEKGYTTYTCACGDSYVDSYVLPLGHDWGSGKVTKEPTATENGIKTYICARCGETKTEVIPAGGCPSAGFTDVPGEDNWAHAGIDYCVANGLMSGVGGNLFAPKKTTTRAQIVQILYNLQGEPRVYGSTPFTDLTNDWYQDAILWAYQTGVVAGTSGTTFDPDLPVTREQIAVILMEYTSRVLGLKNLCTPADLSRYPDAGSVSDWAKNAMADAVALGLISGASNGGQTYLEPQGSATREQVATILMEFCKNVKK